MDEPELRVEPDSDAGVSLPVRRVTPREGQFKHRFVLKVTALIMSLIFFGGIGIATVTAFRFRREIYQQEFSSAFTVYTAVANYLSGHYKANRGHFVARSLDYVLEHRMLKADETRSGLITHRPSRLVLYDRHGRVVYEFSTGEKPPPARDLPPQSLPLNFGPEYDPAAGLIRIAGPVSPEGDVPGYVSLCMPTDIRTKVRELYGDAFGIMLAMMLLAVGISWIFARHVLAPIEALTQAADLVHRGNLNQKVEVSTNDEIGVLTITFNEMVSSLAKRISLLHRIQEWTVQISRELESQRLYGTLTSMFAGMSSAQACRLYVYDKRTGDLEATFDHGAGNLPAAEDDELTRRAFADRWAQHLRADGTTGTEPAGAVEVAIPLLSGEHRVGVVRIGRHRENAPYDDETLTILQTLAQHASVAIDNAHLYGELTEKERIEQEMRWAREIQQSLLPSETPRIPGYEVCGVSMPATEVGGDYFDFVTTDGKWYLVIADVSGKGVPAALIMSIIRSLIRTYVEFEPSPREVLVKVNRKLYGDLEPEMFVTLMLVCLDPTTHRLWVVRAGHEPVLVRRANGKIQAIRPNGVALGIVDVPTFESLLEMHEGTLGKGETLIMYTDGITEAQNTEAEDFGYGRLEEFLGARPDETAKRLFDAILSQVQAFAGNASQHDDMTLVVAKREASA
ncbi:MAG: SpoIIE family protein phosphatase [Kiritimatiellae bacterium]|nr:SpoIIE family protein phosphatase [Kiritimatiellia bacterium]